MFEGFEVWKTESEKKEKKKKILRSSPLIMCLGVLVFVKEMSELK